MRSWCFVNLLRVGRRILRNYLFATVDDAEVTKETFPGGTVFNSKSNVGRRPLSVDRSMGMQFSAED